MKKPITFLFTILVLAGLLSCSDDNEVTPAPLTPPTDYTTVQDLLVDLDFSGSVLVQKNGQDLLREGFGLADVSGNLPNDPSLSYRIGSVTKAFTAMAIVQLMRDGLIEDFDQKLSDFDDEFPFGDQITLRHLLTHNSGIPDYVGPVEDFVEENNYFITPEEIFDIISESLEEDGLLYTPGSLSLSRTHRSRPREECKIKVIKSEI